MLMRQFPTVRLPYSKKGGPEEKFGRLRELLNAKSYDALIYPGIDMDVVGVLKLKHWLRNW